MYKIYKIYNVFSNKERKKIIKDCQPLLLTGSQLADYYNETKPYPGRQSHPTVHLNSNFKWVYDIFLKKIKEELKFNFSVHKSWFKYTVGGANDISWHNHTYDNVSFTSVYYIKTNRFLSGGTMFTDSFNITSENKHKKRKHEFVRSPQNSLLIFPSNLVHSTPNVLFRNDRYVLSTDFHLRGCYDFR